MSDEWTELNLLEHDILCEECGAPADFARAVAVARRVRKGVWFATEISYIRSARCRDHAPGAARRFGLIR